MIADLKELPSEEFRGLIGSLIDEIREGNGDDDKTPG